MARRNRPDPFHASAWQVMRALDPTKQSEMRNQAAGVVKQFRTHPTSTATELRALAACLVVAAQQEAANDTPEAAEAEVIRLSELGCTRHDVALITGHAAGRITDILGTTPINGIGRPGHPRRDEAVELLRAGSGVSVVARHVGVARSTVYAWRAEMV